MGRGGDPLAAPAGCFALRLNRLACRSIAIFHEIPQLTCRIAAQSTASRDASGQITRRLNPRAASATVAAITDIKPEQVLHGNAAQ
jgi:hypothetical protein